MVVGHAARKTLPKRRLAEQMTPWKKWAQMDVVQAWKEVCCVFEEQVLHKYEVEKKKKEVLSWKSRNAGFGGKKRWSTNS